MKKRILLCNDASFLATGFGTYGHEILTRLAKTDKFELAELGAYGLPNDSRQGYMNWKFYGNLPESNIERELYNSRPTNQFGEWKFDSVCANFRPNIVWDIRDCQMLEFAERSPARPYFQWVIMPTIDAIPLHESWLATYMTADAVFSWTDWGKQVIDEVSHGRVNTRGVAPPGLHPSFKPPIDKVAHRKKLGLPEDIIVIGTVMRNQPRKLFPELISAFAEILRRASEPVKDRLYLYLHTTYPDKKGWPIPKLIREAGISNRVLVTYTCESCNIPYPNYFQDARAVCKFCGKYSALMPHTQASPTSEVLAQIYQLFDIYVQYSQCEGFGLPQIEAAACGVPVFAIDYSAMSDILRKVNGTPIKVSRYTRDVDGHTFRALPDDEDFIAKALDFIEMPATMRLRAGQAAAKAAHTNFSWDRTAKLWEDFFDALGIDDELWSFPPNIKKTPTEIPTGMNNSEFVRWCVGNILGRADLLDSYTTMTFTELLNYGYHNEAILTKETVLQHFIELRNTYNYFEENRYEEYERLHCKRKGTV